MRMLTMIICVTLSATIVAAAQAPAAQTRAVPPQGLVLRSCTPVADSGANRFTISKARSPKSWYRSTGSLLLKTGQRVHVAGRLIPSANVAAQAGSLDPTVAAMAMTSGDAFRPPVGAARKPAVAFATPPAGVRVDCGVR